MSLARELRMTKARLLAEISPREIAQWIAYFSYESKKEKEAEEEEKGTVLREKFKAIMGGKIEKKKSKQI